MIHFKPMTFVLGKIISCHNVNQEFYRSSSVCRQVSLYIATGFNYLLYLMIQLKIKVPDWDLWVHLNWFSAFGRDCISNFRRWPSLGYSFLFDRTSHLIASSWRNFHKFLQIMNHTTQAMNDIRKDQIELTMTFKIHQVNLLAFCYTNSEMFKYIKWIIRKLCFCCL